MRFFILVQSKIYYLRLEFLAINNKFFKKCLEVLRNSGYITRCNVKERKKEKKKRGAFINFNQSHFNHIPSFILLSTRTRLNGVALLRRYFRESLQSVKDIIHVHDA